MDFHTEWVRSHPYTAACVAAGALLVIGTLIVGESASRPAATGIRAWGGADPSLINSTSFSQNAPTVSNEPTLLNTQPAPDFTALPIGQHTDAEQSQDSTYNLNALLSLLSKPSGNTGAGGGNPDLSGAYAFIPQGLISTTTAEPSRTPVQQTLYQYGNDVGSYISTYEDSHKNTNQILTDQVRDRQSAAKAQAVKDIGASLASVGKNLQSMDDVPSSVKNIHIALAQSYIDMGEKLALIPDAQRDEDYLAAIDAYNAKANAFAKQFVALANVFVGTGVVFSPTDPGSVFSFTAFNGL